MLILSLLSSDYMTAARQICDRLEQLDIGCYIALDPNERVLEISYLPKGEKYQRAVLELRNGEWVKKA